MEVAVVVIVYHPNEKVVKAIKSYFHYFKSVIIVDNSDNNNRQLFSLFSNSIYIPLYQNTGIATALNIGFKRAIELNYEYIVSMDQDSSFDTNILNVYEEFILNNDTSDVASLSPYYKFDRNIFKQNLDGTRKQFEYKKITMQSGVLFFAEKFKKIGEFNQKLFLDVVDWEYFYRLYLLGYKNIQCNEAILIHNPANSLVLFSFCNRQIKVGFDRPERYYYQIRNLIWCMIRYKSYFMVKTLFYKIFKIIFIFSNKKEYLKLAFKAIKDAFSNNLGPINDE